MTDSMKYKLRGVLYLLSGGLLTLSGIISWDGLDYIWGRNAQLDENTADMRVTIIIIGLALMAASYLEFVNVRISRKADQRDDKDF